MPFIHASRDVIFVNTSPEKHIGILKPKKLLEALPPESTDVTCDNLFNRYKNRPVVLKNVCLAHFATHF